MPARLRRLERLEQAAESAPDGLTPLEEPPEIQH
jgi:hypothetical protein